MKFALTLKEMPAQDQTLDFVGQIRTNARKAIYDNYERKIENLVRLGRYEEAEEWTIGLLGKLREWKKQ